MHGVVIVNQDAYHKAVEDYIMVNKNNLIAKKWHRKLSYDLESTNFKRAQ